jgi:hypothetical protein
MKWVRMPVAYRVAAQASIQFEHGQGHGTAGQEPIVKAQVELLAQLLERGAQLLIFVAGPL